MIVNASTDVQTRISHLSRPIEHALHAEGNPEGTGPVFHYHITAAFTNFVAQVDQCCFCQAVEELLKDTAREDEWPIFDAEVFAALGKAVLSGASSKGFLDYAALSSANALP